MHNKTLKKWKKYHKWPGLIMVLFLILFSLSGILLNHRNFVSGTNINRNYLPKIYRYHNWNLAAVKSALFINKDRILLYGNIGIWLTDSEFKKITSYNKGFPPGIDKRKIFDVLYTTKGELYAATQSGLYRFYKGAWNPLSIPGTQERMVSLFEKGGKIYALSRSYLFVISIENQEDVEQISLPPPKYFDHKTELFKTLWVIHSGKLFGKAGKLFVDLLGIVILVLSVTAIIYFFAPRWIKRRKAKNKKNDRLKTWYRGSLKWHNTIGAWVWIFLLVLVVTGMFLRPPLLIAIAHAKTGTIPFTILDTPNPWFDKLRDMTWDEDLKRYIVATSDGLYFTGETFTHPLEKFPVQPPVSVMGITVLEKAGTHEYLIGSFRGLFYWDIRTGTVINYISGKPYLSDNRQGIPFGTEAVTGYIKIPEGSAEYWFDYDKGVSGNEAHIPFPEMPEDVLSNAPMSLWNFALEVHTGRIYQVLFGKFYILFIPLAGITTLLILISGYVVWRRVYRKPRKNK